MLFALTVLATLTFGILYASVFEWVFHKYLMHRPLGRFRYPFETHALTHHRLFKADRTYHLQLNAHLTKIHMAWWNGPVLVAIGMFPFAIAAALVDLSFGKSEMFAVLGVGLLISACYYLVYEYLHWCMHLPKNRRVERARVFRMLNGHHVLHHRYMGKNFNVVLPFADLVFGTLLTRAPRSFSQVRGPAVPNLQP